MVLSYLRKKYFLFSGSSSPSRTTRLAIPLDARERIYYRGSFRIGSLSTSRTTRLDTQTDACERRIYPPDYKLSNHQIIKS